MELIIKNKINANASSNHVEHTEQKTANSNLNPSSNLHSNKQLVHWYKMQNEFVSIASHEMRTPIQSILTYSELLHSRINDISDECVEAIYRNALRLQKLSNNLLDIARIENHTFTLKNEKFDINEIILHTIQEFVKQIQNSGTKTKNVTFLFPAEDSLYVWADKDRISQVVSNLIDNAFKFTHTGEITIKTKLENEMIVVSVKDTGIGINSQAISQLFSKYSTSLHNGTGLGLYISKTIIEKHGGRIWVKNNIDKGATFVFEIPFISTNRSSHHTKDTVNF